MKNHLVSFMVLVLVLLVVSAINSFGQEDPLYTQYLNNPILINPAYTGINNNFQAAASYRKQWGGLAGSPQTINFNSQLSLVDNRMGLGLIVVQDKIGVNANTETYATYSYKIKMQQGVLSFGLQGGIINYTSKNSTLNAYDPADPAFNADLTITKPNVGAGLIFRSDRIFIGFAVPRMLKLKTSFDDVATNFYSQHYYANLGYLFFLSNHLRLKPSVLLKGVGGAPLSVDYTVLLNMHEKYTAGIYLRNLNTYGMIVQMKMLDKLQLGYAVGIPTKNSVGSSFISHEFCLSINLNILGYHDKSVNSF